MNIADLIYKRVLVVGLGVTGLSVVRYLDRHAVPIELADEQVSDNTLDELGRELVIHRDFTQALFCSFDVIVLSPGIPRAHPAIVAALQSGIPVIGDIELFAHAVQVPVLAVTGSNGKSTAVAWLADALNACGISAAACGNIGEPALDSLLTEVSVLVLELSSYQLESTRNLRPLAAAVLNVSEDHMDRYKDMEHYAEVKRRVYRHATHCIANLDDQRTWPVDETDCSCAFFTLSESGSATDATARAGTCWHRSALAGISLSMPGEHNVANALAVLALGTTLDIPVEQLRDALPLFHGLAHRSEYVGEHNGVLWYNDSKGTNTDACDKAIKAMPGPVILIAGGIGKGADFSTLRASVSAYVKLLILIGRDRQLIADELQGCADIEMADSLHQAVTVANEHAASGDVVLLSPACSSFDMFRNFEDRGVQFKTAVEQVMAA